MKKEFKAPIVETKELFAQDVMSEIAIFNLSTGKTARNGVVINDQEIAAEYDKWNGLQ